MWVQECVCVCVSAPFVSACAWVRSSLIFSHANEGVGAKITRPIFPPPQWGHYLLMFCIFPPSLPLSRFLHPLPVARVFSLPSCYTFGALSAIIKARRCLQWSRTKRRGLPRRVTAKIRTTIRCWMSANWMEGKKRRRHQVAKYSCSHASGFLHPITNISLKACRKAHFISVFPFF